MSRSIALLVGCCWLLAGCKKEESPAPAASVAAAAAPAPAPAPTPSAAVAPALSAAPAPEKPTGLFADKLPEGLAPLDVAPLDVATMTKSTDLDTAANDARKAKDFVKAKQLYLDALKTDPGNHAARYNLARTLIMEGQVDSGLAVLDQLFRAEDCYVCQGLLLRAAQEKDFKPAANRPEFKERTSTAGKTLPTFQRAAEQLIKWLDKPSLDNLPPTVDTRTFIVLQDAKGFHKFKGVKALLEYVVDDEKKNFPKGRKWGPTLGPPLGMSLDCKNECCDVNTYDPPRDRSVLRQICFTAQGNVATSLFKLKAD